MSKNTYFEGKVLTAPPQRLQLMLIEGSIRFGRQAEQLLIQGDTLAAGTALMRVIDIVGELSAGARQSKTELAQKIADVYRFIFLRVSQAKVNNDLASLQEALGLLEYERETWQLVCNQMEADATAKPAAQQAAASTSVPRPAILSNLSGSSHTSVPSQGFSFEA
jgi:flagellar protein FliS